MGYRIAQAAERSGVPASTIRYYEDEGLLPPADREANGYRSYGDRDVARLRFLDRARALDLPMDALGELLALWEDGGATRWSRNCVNGSIPASPRPSSASRP